MDNNIVQIKMSTGTDFFSHFPNKSEIISDALVVMISIYNVQSKTEVLGDIMVHFFNCMCLGDYHGLHSDL